MPGRLRGTPPSHRAAFLAEPQARPVGAGREPFGRRREGTEFPVEIGLDPVHTGDRLLVFASIVDVTQRRRPEEQLRQSRKLEAVGTIAGGIAYAFDLEPAVRRAFGPGWEPPRRAAFSRYAPSVSQILRKWCP